MVRCLVTLAVSLLAFFSGCDKVPSSTQSESKLSLARSAPVGSSTQLFQSYQCDDGYQLRYALMRPEEGEHGPPFPLVLCLHGGGGGTHAPEAMSRCESVPPCFVLVPSVPPREFSWGSRRRAGLPYVFELLDDLLDQEHIDVDRIYVTGQSMGGAGTYAAVSARPDFFAAAVPVCGWWNTADARRFHHVPMWVFHGTEDRIVPVQRSRVMVEALREAGGTPRYSEMPDVRHNAWIDAYASDELWQWLFGHRRGETSREQDGSS